MSDARDSDRQDSAPRPERYNEQWLLERHGPNGTMPLDPDMLERLLERHQQSVREMIARDMITEAEAREPDFVPTPKQLIELQGYHIADVMRSQDDDSGPNQPE